MELEVKKTCPLGSVCREVIDGVINECIWLTKIAGVDAENKPTETENCAMVWMPILQVEGNNQTRIVGASVQSLRNETVKRQDFALGLVSDAKTISSS